MDSIKTKIIFKKVGDKHMPLKGKFGFCPNAVATENCLVIVPCPEERNAVIISEDELNEIGLYYLDKETHKRLAHLFNVVHNCNS